MEFSRVPILRAKVLSPWEYERGLMPERSYQAPHGVKGFRMDHYAREFGEPTDDMLPELYQQHLQKVRTEYKDFVQRATKYGRVPLDDKIDNLKLKHHKTPFRLINSVQKNDFGFDKHSTFESEVIRQGRRRTELTKLNNGTMK